MSSNLGLALQSKGNLNGAIAAFREAMRSEPHAYIATYLGIALKDRGDLGGAIAAFNEAIRLDPKHAWILATGPAKFGTGDWRSK